MRLVPPERVFVHRKEESGAFLQQRIFLIVVLIGLCLACRSPESSDSDGSVQARAQAREAERRAASEALHDVVESYYDGFLSLHPMLATVRGDNRYNDVFGDYLSETYRSDFHELVINQYARLKSISFDLLSEQDQLTYRIFETSCTRALEAHDIGWLRAEALLPVNQIFAMPISFANLAGGSGLQPFENASDYDRFHSRMQGFPLWVDQAIANMQQGVTEGIVQPRVLIERVLPQLEAHLVDHPVSSVFFTPILNLPPTIPQAERERLTSAYEQTVMQGIVPAYRRLYLFLKDEYLAHAREPVGLAALDHGASWYAFLTEQFTTTQYTPGQLHEIGQREVSRISLEMDMVRREVGFRGDLKEFFAYVKSDPRFFFETEAELLTAYRGLKDQIQARLHLLFDGQPSADYQILPVETYQEQSAPTAFYQPAKPDGSVPGTFFVNTYDLRSRPKYAMTALSLHEGNPGHHYQISMAMESSSLPRFRRFGQFTAYIEGWGLYAESLGKELELYQDPYVRFGQLAAEQRRANRLVVDTGIHAKLWSREQAIEFMLANSPISAIDAAIEVERYIAMPAQALAYKTGQLKIEKLRRYAEKHLGTGFNLKKFHHEVLRHGALPLDTLETKIRTWVQNDSP